MNIYNLLRRICTTKQYVNLKTLCSIKIGGIARYVCYPNKTSQLKKLVYVLNKYKIQYHLIGKGTNIIFEDGFRNFVLICTDKLNKYYAKKNTVFAFCGLGLNKLNYYLYQNGIGGLEWSYGIPGSIGGATVMNAGAFKNEMSNFIKYAVVLSNNHYKVISNRQLNFGYRNSIIKNSNIIVVKVCLNLFLSNSQIIKQKQLNYVNLRKQSQPLNYLSCGSVFLKTNNESAGKIIDKMGLKGVKLGEAQISNKHANFFINLSCASSKDMHNLIDMVKSMAKSKGIYLQEEVIFI